MCSRTGSGSTATGRRSESSATGRMLLRSLQSGIPAGGRSSRRPHRSETPRCSTMPDGQLHSVEKSKWFQLSLDVDLTLGRGSYELEHVDIDAVHFP